MRAVLLGLVLLAPALQDRQGCAFDGQQTYCYHFCREHLKGRADVVSRDNQRFYVKDDGEKSYCYCEVRVQLPVKLEAEKAP